MTRNGAHIRSLNKARKGAEEAENQLKKLAENTRLKSVDELGEAFKNYDLLISQFVYLSAVENYIEKGGKSRGSYLVYDSDGKLPVSDFPEKFRYSLSEENLMDKIQEVTYDKNKCLFNWRKVNEIPADESWFENVWNEYRDDEIIK